MALLRLLRRQEVGCESAPHPCTSPRSGGASLLSDSKGGGEPVPTLRPRARSVDAAPPPELRQADCTVSRDAPPGLIPRTRSIGRGALLLNRRTDRTAMTQPKLGIDVSKDALDVNVVIAGK